MIWMRRHFRFNFFLAMLFIVTGLIALVPVERRIGTPLLVGFDIAAILYLIATLPPFSRLGPDGLRKRAIDNGDNLHVLLLIGAVVVAVVMTALGRELVDKAATSVIFSAFTLALAWLFINTLFLLHYAQVFYTQRSGADHGGLQFAGDDPLPNAWDLGYFAFTVAIIFSVSDVIITSRRLRRIVILHGMLAFGFNIFAIGVSIGLISNLFG